MTPCSLSLLTISGECAVHFQELLSKYPPQTSSRETACQWGCHIHNKVRESLDKEVFDCGTIAEHYKCGCAEDEEGFELEESGNTTSSTWTDIGPAQHNAKKKIIEDFKYRDEGRMKGG
jgi:hypothetical protein